MKLKMNSCKLVYVLLALFFSSCHFNSSYVNREEDKRDAEKITTELYDKIKAKNYGATTRLFSKEFLSVTDTAKLFNLFAKTAEKLGDLQKAEISDWETKRQEGTDPFSNYAFVYHNTYSKYSSEETIKMQKQDDGQIRIMYYNINSKGFLQ